MTTEIEELRAALEQGKINLHGPTYAELPIKLLKKQENFKY